MRQELPMEEIIAEKMMSVKMKKGKRPSFGGGWGGEKKSFP